MQPCEVTFWTPIAYKTRDNCSEHFVEWVDEYFRWSRQVAVIQSDENKALNGGFVLFEERELNYWGVAFKIISYMTVLIPIIMLILKAINRSSIVLLLPPDSSVEAADFSVEQVEGSTRWKEVSCERSKGKDGGLLQLLEPSEKGQNQKWTFFPPEKLSKEGTTYCIRSIFLCQQGQIQLIWRPAQQPGSNILINNGSLGPVLVKDEGGFEQRLASNGMISAPRLSLSIEST